MNAQQKTLAQACRDASDSGAMTFPQLVGALAEGGFEGYLIDFRRSVATYYLPSGEALELPTHKAVGTIAEAFDETAIKAAIREAQLLVPGYTYRGFCAKVIAGGCAGYMVSFLGRRAVYFGRTGETHVEMFPQAA